MKQLLMAFMALTLILATSVAPSFGDAALLVTPSVWQITLFDSHGGPVNQATLVCLTTDRKLYSASNNNGSGGRRGYWALNGNRLSIRLNNADKTRIGVYELFLERAGTTVIGNGYHQSFNDIDISQNAAILTAIWTRQSFGCPSPM